MDTAGDSTARDDATPAAGSAAAANVARNVALNGQRATAERGAGAPGGDPGRGKAPDKGTARAAERGAEKAVNKAGSKSGDRAGDKGAAAAKDPGGAGAGADDDAAEEHDATWIYQQLGLSPEAYKGDRPRVERRPPSPLPPVGRRPVSGPGVGGLGFDFADLAPGDPHDSPFPPGSLGRDEDMPTTGPKAKPFIHHQGSSTAPIIPGSAPASASPGAAEAAVRAAADAASATADPASVKADPASVPAEDAPAAHALAEGAPVVPGPAAAPPRPAVPRHVAREAAAEPRDTPAERPRPAIERPRPSSVTPPAPDTAPSHNPFQAYDERSRADDFVLPPLPPLPEPLRATETARGVRSWDAPLPEDDNRITSDSLTAEKVLKGRKARPTKGWRKGLLAMGVNLGPSSKELAVQELEARVRTPIQGCHRLAVISLKGGVGKTTTIAAMGSVFASLRGDRVIAVDANPDRGTLGEKIVGEAPSATVRDFVGKIPRLTRYSDIREFIGQADSRLEVLASESDPLASLAFSEQDYRVIAEVLERFYNLILTDCGTGLLHSAMVGVLAKAEQVVIVSSASLDGARSASATLDWLEAHGYQELARDSVSVISSVRMKADGVHLSEIEQHFASRTRAVVSIPYDEHLAEGGTIDIAALSPRTYQAYLELAATVGDGFARTVGYR